MHRLDIKTYYLKNKLMCGRQVIVDYGVILSVTEYVQ